MKIKNCFRILFILPVVLLSSCDFVKGIYTTIPSKSDEGLIAETKPVLTVEELIAEDRGFSTLSDIMDIAEMDEEMVYGKESFTIFAPVNLAFEKLSGGISEKLMTSEDKKYFTTLLNCHILSGQVHEADLIQSIKKSKGSIKLKTVNGSILTATLKGNAVFLIDKNGNGGKLVSTDITASNGLIHTIDAVMMPKMQ